MADESDAWVNVERGYGQDAAGEGGGAVGRATELPIRMQFAAWLDYMTKAEAA